MCFLKVNKAKCLLCGDIIESRYRHDFVWCRCRKLAVDGGHAYARRVFDPPGHYVDHNEYQQCDEADCPDKNIERGASHEVAQ